MERKINSHISSDIFTFIRVSLLFHVTLHYMELSISRPTSSCGPAVNLPVYMYACMYVCIYVCVCMYAYMYKYKNIYIYVHVNINIYA
jgi:hypothetical protein